MLTLRPEALNPKNKNLNMGPKPAPQSLNLKLYRILKLHCVLSLCRSAYMKLDVWGVT